MVPSVKIENIDVGESAGPSVSPERVTIPVTGMTCAACQSFIQRTLTGKAGVQDASVNLMMNNATFDCWIFRHGVVHAADEHERRWRNVAHERPADELEYAGARSCAA